MKKILTLFAVVGLFAFTGCSDNNNEDHDTISEVYEVSNVNFTAANGYNPMISLNPAIYQSDMVLLYRLAGVDGGKDVWKLTPETYFFSNGTLNFAYNYNFTVNDVSIYLDGNSLASVPSEYRLNQIFRIVIVPGYVTTGKSANKPDYSDYNAVIAKYGIDDSNIKKIKLK
jgi:hypothetical protein